MGRSSKMRLVVMCLLMGWCIVALADGRTKKKVHYNPQVWNPYNCCHSLTGGPNAPAVIVDIYIQFRSFTGTIRFIKQTHRMYTNATIPAIV
jgi:hypothetical protein